MEGQVEIKSRGALQELLSEFKHYSEYPALESVYFDLYYSQKCSNITVHCNKLRPFLVAQFPPRDQDDSVNAGSDESWQVVIPMLVSEKTSLRKIREIFDEIKLSHKVFVAVMAIVDVDSTVLYYNISDGIKKPRQHADDN